ncbi:MAG TPA: DUF6531 domain-containing protein, partial [Thermoanaerobaculia bacterium]|nr:DUF6531 domain-containing protein [Thermoanaerobaculia bacterium]
MAARALSCVAGLLLLVFIAPLAFAQCNDEPIVSVSLTEVNYVTGGIYTVFSHNHPDSIAYTWRGATTKPVVSSVDSTFDVVLMGSCMTQPETLHVESTKCGRTRTWDIQFAPPPTKPELKEEVSAGKGTSSINVRFFFPAGWAQLLKATVAGENGSNIVVLNETTLPSAGSRTISGTEQGGVIVVEATSCTGIMSSLELEIPKAKKDCMECSPCSDCVGHPVHTLSGNMQYEEVDPLPGFDVFPFRRVYDSVTSYDGHFGRRWSSIFGATLSTFPAADGGEYVNLRTETGKQYLFRGVAGLFRQIYPSGRTQGVLTRASDGTWVHRESGQTRARVYAADGKVLAFRDTASGREVRVTWSGGRPVAVSDSWGAWSLTITTDPASGRVTSISADGDPSLVWTYVYEENRLVRVESPVGTWRTYTHRFHPTGMFWYPMTEVRDGAGKLIESHNYAQRDLASDSFSANGDVTSIVIAEAGRVPGELKTIVTYRTGRQELHYRRLVAHAYRTVEIDGGCTSCGGRNQVLAYDSSGNAVRIQGADGYVTESAFDSEARVTQQRTALRPANCDPETASDRCRQTPTSLETVTLVPTPATLATNFEYTDPSWPDRATVTRTSSIRNASELRVDTVAYHPATGAIVTRSTKGWTGDPLREETRTSTTAFYDVAEHAAFTPSGGWNAAWSQLAQPYGLPKSIDGPRTDVADVSTFVYYPIDPSVPPLQRGRLAASRNAAGHITAYEDYDRHGNARRVTDPNGVVTTMVYDALGRLTSSTLEGISGCDTVADPLCGTPLTTSRVFNGATALSSETRPRGGITMYDYDALRRVASISRSTTGTDMTERIAYTYDPATGHKSAEIISARTGTVWTEKTRTSYAYDTLAQLRQVTHAGNASTEYTYDAEGRIATARDENHTSPNTFYTYDAAGRLSQVRQALNGTPNGFVTTHYIYDAHGNLASATDPNGNVTTYVYDDFGQMLSQVSPVTGTTTYSYDTAGQLVSTTDANGATTTRTYDILGRVLSSVSAGGGDSETVTWTYDTAPFGVGRVATMLDPTGSTSYGYERRGLLARETKTVGASTYVTRYGYDEDGNRSRITYPSGRVVDYTFDRAGRPITASTNGVPLVTSTSYLPFGPRTEIVFGNGTRQATSFDSRYRPDVNSLIGPNGVIASYDYAHDPAGNVTQIHDVVDPRYNRNFGYDDLNRLTSATSGSMLWGSGSYTYDAMGNLKQQTLGSTTTAFAYHGTTPKITSVTAGGISQAVTYDTAGNELQSGPATASYSPRNHMQSRAGMRYSYDGRGVRTVSTRVLLLPQIESLTADKPSPQRTESRVTFTVGATGGQGPLSYNFLYRNTAGGTWQVGQDWSPNANWTWQPSTAFAGVWDVKVEVGGHGASQPQDTRTMTYEIYLPPQATLDALTADKPSPQRTESRVTFT